MITGICIGAVAGFIVGYVARSLRRMTRDVVVTERALEASGHTRNSILDGLQARGVWVNIEPKQTAGGGDENTDSGGADIDGGGDCVH